MQQQGFKPDFYLQDPTIYDKRYLDQAGGLAEGDYIYAANDLFENKGNAEVQALPVLPAAGEARRDPQLLRALRVVGHPALRREGDRARRQARPGIPGPGGPRDDGLDRQRRAHGDEPRHREHPALPQGRPVQGRSLAAGLARLLPVRPGRELRHRRLRRQAWAPCSPSRCWACSPARRTRSWPRGWC
ncbi:hypothetical protein G5V59_08900 [Nocardioides sp. W3-2-3]|uniref:hypothetical protein n=1 Tax=Nocardioides convexus TaxID=2712224 RepID=UPI0024189517|nr:hypothetical protein [Nocardioides convexus]NHA00205.1 hypothetical protein [Nocardioides convexus]